VRTSSLNQFGAVLRSESSPFPAREDRGGLLKVLSVERHPKLVVALLNCLRARNGFQGGVESARVGVSGQQGVGPDRDEVAGVATREPTAPRSGFLVSVKFGGFVMDALPAAGIGDVLQGEGIHSGTSGGLPAWLAVGLLMRHSGIVLWVMGGSGRIVARRIQLVRLYEREIAMKPPRFRLSTLLLLVIILALALTLVIDRWKREQERRRLAASQQRANETFRRSLPSP
jgi:hypothetical protein